MAATPIPPNAAPFTADEIVEATGASVVQAPRRAIEGVVLDSRRVAPGNLFVALRGENHDAHDYLAQVFAAGAHAVVVDREVEAPDGVGVFRVDDTLTALGALGRLHRRRFDVPVVALTGSVGKTTTKELIAAALVGMGRHAVWTRGNLNNRIGVPMTLFTIDPEHDAAVIEIGMNVPGEIAALTALVEPTVGLVTAVAAVHTEGVGGIEGVAREKGALLEGLGPDATAIWCADYPRIEPFAARSKAARKLRYGLHEDADVRLVRWELDGHGGTDAHYQVAGRGAVDARLTFLGEAAAVNAAAAIAVTSVLAPDAMDDAIEALSGVPHAPHRMVPIELPGGPLVIDDTYNASPRSAQAALETAAALADVRGGKLIAVLGDMLELGREEDELHAGTGRDAVRVGAALLIAVGERMSHAGRAALKAAMERPSGARTKVVILRKVEDAPGCVRDAVTPKDVVLVKGSRGMRMERVVDALTREEAEA